MPNPFLPLDEYIPDGEAHVFGDRVYLYGSHDAPGGNRFCMLDYTVWSAPVTDLTAWICHGISYRKSQDPRSRPGKEVDLYAPDCVQGNDGRFYLYYVAMGPNTKNFGPISVAVSQRPEGPFEYLGDVRYPDGRPVLKYLTNDPAVINDNGKIYLYYGWGLGRDFRSKLYSPIYNIVQSKLFSRPISEIKATKPSILSCAVTELEDDMLTVKYEPKAVLDSMTTADKNSELYHHAFYEAPSIRKFNDNYYLIYSSGKNNELCYAMSKYPDRDFEYKGVLISNSDLGYKGNTQALAPAGTIHGSVEYINGQYYVFYHRCTHNTDFSRQACMEKLYMNADETFDQVEITTQGIDEALTKGRYPASLCCNLYHPNKKYKLGNGYGRRTANITHSQSDGQYITAVSDGTIIGFKYFNFSDVNEIAVTVRYAKGKILICTDPFKPLAEIMVNAEDKWEKFKNTVKIPDGIAPLYLIYKGRGKADVLEMEVL